MAGADPVGQDQRAAHEDGYDEAGDEAEGEDGLLHVRLPGVGEDAVTMWCGAPSVIILLDDFVRVERKSCFRVTRSGQQAELLAALHGLGAARGSQLVEGAGAVGLYDVLGDEELSGDLAIAEAAGDEVEDFELAGCDAEALLSGCVGSESWSWLGARAGGRDEDFSYHDRLPSACDAEAEPDAKGREENADERAVELDRVLDHDEAVFDVLEGGDEEPTARPKMRTRRFMVECGDVRAKNRDARPDNQNADPWTSRIHRPNDITSRQSDSTTCRFGGCFDPSGEIAVTIVQQPVVLCG